MHESGYGDAPKDKCPGRCEYDIKEIHTSVLEGFILTIDLLTDRKVGIMLLSEHMLSILK